MTREVSWGLRIDEVSAGWAQWKVRTMSRSRGQGSRVRIRAYSDTLHSEVKSMKHLVLNGWNVGMNKVLLTKTLRTEFGYSLEDGKSITDQVLDNMEIRIPFDREPLVAEDFVKRLREIGAKASIDG